MQSGYYLTRLREKRLNLMATLPSQASDTANMADTQTPGKGEKSQFDILLEKMTKIESKVDKLDSIDEKLNTITTDLDEIKKEQGNMKQSFKSYDSSIKALQRENAMIKVENNSLKKQVNDIKEKQIKLECFERRNNLLFGNLSESMPENCEEKVRFFIKNTLGIESDVLKFERVHRLGANPIRGKARPIIARFCYFSERQLVWQNRKQLSKSAFWIAEDFAEEVKQRRQTLKPILRKAIEQNKTAYLTVDKLVIDNKTYQINNLITLPEDLNPAKLATVAINDEMTAFSGAASPLSNFHPCTFEADGLFFSTSEQYFQYHKAKINNDLDSARKILSEISPAKCKQIGDRVKVINQKMWDERDSLKVMYDGCTAKFTQNRKLRSFLLSIKSADLVEGRKDDFWGAGKTISELQTDATFKGSNHLGKLLVIVRNELTPLSGLLSPHTPKTNETPQQFNILPMASLQ